LIVSFVVPLPATVIGVDVPYRSVLPYWKR
jgi:hypothetical protein